MHVSISPGNMKMGSVPSVSLPAHETCPSDAPCFGDCYGWKIMRLRKTVRDAYARNFAILQNDPSTYWSDVESVIKESRFFRFHVSGDIVDMRYLTKMIGIAERNPHCSILCFTKKYNIVNTYLCSGKKLPKNLKIIFSVWRNYHCDNPFNLPEAHVAYRNGERTAREDAKFCNGNCFECAKESGGCWTLGNGEQVVFNQH